jgi:hypothetical protein
MENREWRDELGYNRGAVIYGGEDVRTSGWRQRWRWRRFPIQKHIVVKCKQQEVSYAADL